MRPVALITGAGQGIGAACARTLAAEGYACVLMSPSDNSLAVADEIDGIGMKGSATKTADIDDMVAMAMNRFGRIDAVVNNTGNLARVTAGQSLTTGHAYDPALETDILGITDEEWHASLDYYFLNIVRMARAVTGILRAQGGGAIVNISSLAALEPRLSYPLSTPIRTGALSFAKLYADRHARYGIRMNNVLPGFTDSRDFPDRVIGAVPAGRPAKVEEVAATVSFLLSAGAASINGQNIVVDGGTNRGL